MKGRAKALLYGILGKQTRYRDTAHTFQVHFDKASLEGWLITQMQKQEGKCYYCETKQEDILRFIEAGLLKSKRFVTRGKNLEVERLDSQGNSYSPENCVLVCYFCNNDKSDVVSEADYKKFFAPARKMYFETLLLRLNSQNEKDKK